MVEFHEYIEVNKKLMNLEDCIEVHYENIDIKSLQMYLPFFTNIENIYNKTFKISTKVIADENLKIINNTLQNLDLKLK